MTATIATVTAMLAAVLLARMPAAPARVQRLRRHGSGAGSDLVTTAQHWVTAVGRTIRIRALRRSHASPSDDLRIGAAVVLALVALVVDPAVALLGGGTVALGTRWRRLRHRHDRSRRRDLEIDLPELVDLLALTVAAGLTVPESLRAAAPCAPPALRPQLSAAVDAIATGSRIEHALTQLGHSWGDPGRPLVHALVDHTRYGTPLLPNLERVGAETRTRRRRAAETRARRLPVLLLFPLVLCTLPAFGLLTVAPLIAGTLGSLDGSQLEAPASTAP